MPARPAGEDPGDMMRGQGRRRLQAEHLWMRYMLTLPGSHFDSGFRQFLSVVVPAIFCVYAIIKKQTSKCLISNKDAHVGK